MTTLRKARRIRSEPVAPISVAPPQEVISWIRQHAIVLTGPDEAPSYQEAQAILRLTEGAGVIGLGESNHGNLEPLLYRNRLIRFLVEHAGLTAVALESGFAESRQLYDYVLGGGGDPAELVRTGLTDGFGHLRENLELVRWLRAYNSDPGHRPVRLYGIDCSTIHSGQPDARGYGVVLDHVLAYLWRTLRQDSHALCMRLNTFARRFTAADYAQYTKADRAALAAALADVEEIFRIRRDDMIRASSAEDYAWSSREAYDAARLPALFAAWTNDPFEIDTLLRLIELRDRAMADHVQWVMEREGQDGKILLFQANGHVTTEPLVGSVMRAFPRQPKVTGMLLRERMGHAYRAIITVSSRGRSADDPTLGSIDRAFAASVSSPVMLALASAGRPCWWSHLQSASQGDNRVDDMLPAKAVNAIVYFDQLSPATSLV